MEMGVILSNSRTPLQEATWRNMDAVCATTDVYATRGSTRPLTGVQHSRIGTGSLRRKNELRILAQNKKIKKHAIGSVNTR